MLDLVHTDIYENDELKHWGILGMHWGIRRYQNPDGSLTPEGRERYGVKNVSDTKKLSYSKEYMSLKAKKNRTDKENEKLKRLENGKKHFEQAVNDPDYWNRMKDNASANKLSYNAQCFNEYLDSTNYGKGMKAAGTMMAIPVTAAGVGVDVAAVMAQVNMGFPKQVTGLATGLAIPIGNNIGKDLFEKSHKQELQNEIGNKKETKKSYTQTKTERGTETFNDFAKRMGYKSSVDLVKQHYPYDVSEKHMTSGSNEVLNAFGLKTNDLAMDHDGYIVRKDGKDFDFILNGKTHHYSDFDDAYDAYMWGAKPVK